MGEHTPKVLVGCPTSFHKRYCLKQYIEGVKKFTYPNFEFWMVDNSPDTSYYEEIKGLGAQVIRDEVWFDGARDRIAHSRNMLREKALKEGFEYFFSLEQDVIAPPDAIQRLLSHGKKVVCGVVIGYQDVGGKPAPAPMVYVTSKQNPENMWYMDPKEMAESKLVEVRACALGCVIVHKSILEKIQFRHALGFDDMMFSKDVTNLREKIYCDTSVKTEHHVRPGAWDRIEK